MAVWTGPGFLARTCLLLTLTLAGCKRAPENVTPEGAARELLRTFESISADPARSKDALALLGPTTLKNLEARAQRASKVEGRSISPGDYLAAVRYVPHARPAKYETTLNAGGDRAEVSVLDDSGRELLRLPLVKQGELWRVELSLPELQPLHKRAT